MFTYFFSSLLPKAQLISSNNWINTLRDAFGGLLGIVRTCAMIVAIAVALAILKESKL